MSLRENTVKLEELLETVNNLPSAGGEADNTVIDALIERTLSGAYSNDRITTIGNYAFCRTNITSLDCPNVTSMNQGACFYCENLETINLPKLKYIGDSAFLRCTNLRNAVFPELEGGVINAFGYDGELVNADLSKASGLYSGAFRDCPKLVTVILRKVDGICNLSSTDIFKNTPIESGTGYVYVPAALVDSYKAATNWTVYADQIRAIEDYPGICGGAA